ncbi:MAG TPA: protein kinase [Methanosarcina sp.]|nr:protein kinase [Methanosarcina sp.]
MHLEAGSFLRDYQIERLLGKGGMGAVYLAEDNIGRKVAIKELNRSLTEMPDFISRFHNEAKLLGQLSHSNIVGLYSFFEQDGRYYMVMEYAKGRTLKEVIKQTGPIPERRAIYIVMQILNALNYAHKKNIIHRDIKPSNIILDSTDGVKILDFGIAKIMGERGLTQTGQQLGTVTYMSPEQVRAEKEIDGRTDIYSLGVTFFEMLSGRTPYDLNTESDFEIMSKIVQTPLPDPRSYYPDISENTIKVMRNMTEKDKSLRHSDPGILIKHLELKTTNMSSERPFIQNKPDVIEKQEDIKTYKKRSIIFAIIGIVASFGGTLFLPALIVGIATTLFSHKTNTLIKSNDIEKAIKYSKITKFLLIILGAINILLLIAFIFLVGFYADY